MKEKTEKGGEMEEQDGIGKEESGGGGEDEGGVGGAGLWPAAQQAVD